mgnify:CR=1 FL=1
MADGVLGIGGGGSAALSQEVIDKLKSAEKKSQVEPTEKKIENFDLATEKVDAIEQKVLDLLESVRTFDLFNSTGTNTFDAMTASTTGTAATFEALDSGSLSPGTVSVTVSQLAQKDSYQSSTFADGSVQVSGGNDSGDMLVLSQSDRPVYQTNNTTTAPSTDVVDASGGTIILDGTTFTVTSTMTYTELNDFDDDDEIIKFEEKFKKDLTRSTIKIERLECYLSIISRHPEFEKIDIVISKYMPTDFISGFIVDEMKATSKLLDESLE